jgi:tRNA nucleotidyltransferase (CCA-adding enzyme)
MEIYTVGGFVRDKLLGLSPKDRDYVVVGAKKEEMLSSGFTQVGKDFPVFIHKDSGDEYALARKERSTGLGTHDFDMSVGDEVSLIDDLLRRDLTINAMAMDSSGHIEDPFGGRKDLERKLLRHVSESFTEDPLRVLRLARFLSRYAHLGFTVAEETKGLVNEISQSGALATLEPQRVFKELKGALSEKSPHVFFKLLDECGALEAVFPEVHALKYVPQPKEHHPEIDTFVHVMMVLEQSAKHNNSQINFMALTHDFGKAMTPKENWPFHHKHEKLGLPVIEGFCERLHVPNKWRDMSLKTSKLHTHCHRVMELKAKTLVSLFDEFKAFKCPDDFYTFLKACESDAKGRKGFEDRDYPQSEYLRNIASKLHLFSYDQQKLMTIEPLARSEFIRGEKCSFVEQIKALAINVKLNASLVGVLLKNSGDLLPEDITLLDDNFKISNGMSKFERFVALSEGNFNKVTIDKVKSLGLMLADSKKSLIASNSMSGKSLSDAIKLNKEKVIVDFKFA